MDLYLLIWVHTPHIQKHHLRVPRCYLKCIVLCSLPLKNEQTPKAAGGEQLKAMCQEQSIDTSLRDINMAEKAASKRLVRETTVMAAPEVSMDQA